MINSIRWVYQQLFGRIDNSHKIFMVESPKEEALLDYEFLKARIMVSEFRL